MLSNIDSNNKVHSFIFWIKEEGGTYWQKGFDCFDVSVVGVKATCAS